MIPQHLSLTNEQPTPPHVVEAARKVLGVIDLDPATSVEFNERIRATRIIGWPNDGLSEDWYGGVFLNPPGGRTPPKWRKRFGTPSNACTWWRKLVEEYLAERTTRAIFVGFTLEILRTSQGRSPSAMDFPFCVPRERLCFSGDDPTHANVIVSLGNDPALFEAVFSEIGQVRR